MQTERTHGIVREFLTDLTGLKFVKKFVNLIKKITVVKICINSL